LGVAFVTALSLVVFALTFVAWRRYLRVVKEGPRGPLDTCPFSLTDSFGNDHLLNVPHQRGVRWLPEVFSRSARKFPDLPALQIPHTGESLTFAELDARAERVAAALAPFLTGPDQVVAVAMSQDNWQIVASHLGVLKAGGILLFLDASLPEGLMTHILDDARPAVVLTRGQEQFRDLPTVDVLTLTGKPPRREPPGWLDDPTQRLATIFYTSGTTGLPKGVESPHAGYVNLALSYADYFDLVPGMDATSLTSSLGYDGSISEMYSAWVSGCAVVMLTKEQIRSGPDLVSVLREAEVTVLFCPPVLLTTLTPTPNVDLPYPLCRYIVPAGEAFPSALVEPWTRGRRQVINTYGPTEASTDTSRQSLRPGETVTIGSPLPNVTYVILEEDELRPLPHGEEGELCIGGLHVARGYRNLPDETARKFITHPRFGRLYRTGDRCRIDSRTLRVHFLGRIDTQLKVRGHRVEPQAVEDILQSQFEEIEAAVLDYQADALVAFVAAPLVSEEEISGVSPAPAEWAARVTARLAEQLPAPSVPTRIFLVERFAMRPVSGKIDRSRLPLLDQLTGAVPGAGDAGLVIPAGVRDDAGGEVEPPDTGPATVLECEEVLEICRAVLETPLGLDDGFTESGGHSIAIARLAQRLQDAGWVVSVRALLTDINTARKVAGRARELQPAPAVPHAWTVSPGRDGARDEAGARVLSIANFTIRQVLFGCLLYSPALLVVFGVSERVAVGPFFATGTLAEFVVAGLFIYLLGLALPFAVLGWVMLIKLGMGGDFHRNNVTPGIYPKWSRMHLRVWCIGHMEAAVLTPLNVVYRSAPLTAFVLRQLGATVGHNLQCARAASVSGPMDLLFVEDDVAIQTRAYVQTTRWSGQHLCIGPVRLESGCKIGMRAAIAPNVTVGRGTWITPFTPILGDVGSQEMWEGAPAQLVGRVTELNRTAISCRYTQPIWLLETLNILMQICLFWVLRLIPTAAIVWVARGFLLAGGAGMESAYFGLTPVVQILWQLALYTFVSTWASIVATSFLGCLFIRFTAAAPGLYPSRGLRGALLMHRMHLLNAIQSLWTWTITGQYLRALAGVRFPRAGASECDVMFDLVPEFTSADSQVFWSNGCFTNMLDYGAEHFKLRQLDMPRNFFSSNNCVAEHGHFPANFLLGVSTPASGTRFRRGMWSRPAESMTVAGNPPVTFASASFEAENETRVLPNFRLFLTRVILGDLLGIGIHRIAEVFVFAIWFIGFTRLGVHPVVNATVSLILAEFSLILLSIATKKVLVGSEWGSDHTTPFWSWKHFAYFFAQDCFFAWCRTPLRFFKGTILSNPILRGLGCQIGKRTIVIQPMQCSDWNAVSLGSDCIMDGFLQLHTLENMILRVKRTHVRDGCTIDFGATVMGGAMIERDTTLLPLSLVLKEMKLLPLTYEGSPAAPVSGSALLYGEVGRGQFGGSQLPVR